MIGKLHGIIDELDEDSAIINVGGVGYVVFASGRTLGAFTLGSAATLTIETHVREDHIHLYGFLNTQERDWFRLLTTVQGVGAKMALALLSVFDTESLARTIGAQDKTALTRVSGIGAKLAERIVTELKSKVAKMGSFSVTSAAPTATAITEPAKGKKAGKASVPSPDTRIMDDALSALVHLGYQRTEAFMAVSTALQKGEGNATIDAVIKLALKELAK